VARHSGDGRQDRHWDADTMGAKRQLCRRRAAVLRDGQSLARWPVCLHMGHSLRIRYSLIGAKRWRYEPGLMFADLGRSGSGVGLGGSKILD
jgi:hypothetical protein